MKIDFKLCLFFKVVPLVLNSNNFKDRFDFVNCYILLQLFIKKYNNNDI